ncbi:chromosome transmission fidelity factor 18 [Babesia gibsoni]|uniref:Replication factor C subunit 1 n=1 Tax=Babesia gibsoni TaxID=33632 RepID=A0AAD8PG74_BABGI|nr:chromosome transmission fidelity factor 18 [Babesia gibsoni]
MDIRSFFGVVKSQKKATPPAPTPEQASPPKADAGLKTTKKRSIDDESDTLKVPTPVAKQDKPLSSPVDSGSTAAPTSGKLKRLRKVVDSDDEFDDNAPKRVANSKGDSNNATSKVRNFLNEELGSLPTATDDTRQKSSHMQLDIDYYTSGEKKLLSPLSNLKADKKPSVDFDTYLSSYSVGTATNKTKVDETPTESPSKKSPRATKTKVKDVIPKAKKVASVPSPRVSQGSGDQTNRSADSNATVSDLFSENETFPDETSVSPEVSPNKKKKKGPVVPVEHPKEGVTEMRFVFTGVLETLDRDTVIELVRKLGGIYVSGVSGKTDYLVCGEILEDGRNYTEGSKYRKAKELMKKQTGNIKILKETEFLDLIDYEETKKLLFTPDYSSVKEEKEPSALPVKAEANSGIGVPYCEKYRPTSLNDVVGNEGNVRKIMEWLKNWRPGEGPACALLSGPPGVGKTTTARLAAYECGYECVEFNASDLRNKSSVENIAMLATGGQSFNFFGKCNIKKTLVLLDEVDGMGAGDRGGLQAVVALLPRAMSPIICICNDRHNQKMTTLGNKSVDIRFSAPSLPQFTNRILKVCAAEGITLPPERIPQLYEQSGGDFRYVLNAIEFNSVKSSDGRQDSSSINDKKDIGHTKNIFEATGKMFTMRSAEGQGRISAIEEVFFIDYNIMPLMAQENYIRYLDHNRTALPLLKKLSSCFTEADIVEEFLKQRQAYTMLPDLAVLCSVIPAVDIIKARGLCRERLMFPQFLGRYSTTSKNRRFLSEIGKNLGSISHIRSSALVTDGYLNVVYSKIMGELMKGDIEATAAMVEECGLNRELVVDALGSLRLKSQENLYEKIETRKKTALTKRLNELSVKAMPIKRKREAFSRIFVEDESAEESSSESSDSDSDMVKKTTKAVKKRAAAKTGTRVKKV